MEALPSPPGWVTAPLAGFFGLVARARAERALHPKGEVWRASVRPAPGVRSLMDPSVTGTGDRGEAVVRFSRAVGLPSWLPDIHGVAIRLLGAEPVDILLAGSALRVPWALVPAFGRRGTYSSLAHYDLDGKRLRIIGDVQPGRVSLYSETGGSLTPLAEVVLDRRTDEQIRFHPAATGSRLTPVGPVNALRPSAYRASRRSSPQG